MLEIQEQISELLSEPLLETAEEARVAKIRAALDEIRPCLQRDGGDCELVGVEGNVVRVKMKGACIGCQLASVTIYGIQAKLIAKLGLQLRVAPFLGFERAEGEVILSGLNKAGIAASSGSACAFDDTTGIPSKHYLDRRACRCRSPSGPQLVNQSTFPPLMTG